MEQLKLLWRDETGLELSEYAVSAALIVAPIVLAFGALGDRISVVMDRINSLIAT
jgi:Flp pilus assembly pilin Flp